MREIDQVLLADTEKIVASCRKIKRLTLSPFLWSEAKISIPETVRELVGWVENAEYPIVLEGANRYLSISAFSDPVKLLSIPNSDFEIIYTDLYTALNLKGLAKAETNCNTALVWDDIGEEVFRNSLSLATPLLYSWRNSHPIGRPSYRQDYYVSNYIKHPPEYVFCGK